MFITDELQSTCLKVNTYLSKTLGLIMKGILNLLSKIFQGVDIQYVYYYSQYRENYLNPSFLSI